ncbi:MAG: histidinol-phosphatase HisJ family protein [bacterium]
MEAPGSIDRHVHPDYSPDAEGTVFEFCEAARAAGLAGLCFTTHYEPDPLRAHREKVRVDGRLQPVGSDWAGSYAAAVSEAKARFPELRVMLGVEVGYDFGLEEEIRGFLSRHPFEFVIGSVHSLEHVAISSGHEQGEMCERFRDVPAEQFVGMYFSRVRAAAGSGLFDALGHLDIYRRYAVGCFPGLPAAAERELPGALRAIAAGGVALEVNTSAFRRGDDAPYPAPEVLRAAVAAGVRRFTVGSDAHRPADVGAGFDRVRAVLAELNPAG